LRVISLLSDLSTLAVSNDVRCLCVIQGAENAQVHAASIDRTGLQLTIDDMGPQEIKFKIP